MNKSADNYFVEGCGRCEKGGTPDCKIHHWPEVLSALREILVASDLIEACKWGVPIASKNVCLKYYLVKVFWIANGFSKSPNSVIN